MKEISPQTFCFICKHRHENVRQLALQAAKYPGIDMTEAVVQIAGRQIAEKKIPLWAQIEGIRYPKHLSMEQCSSEITARYKASLVKGVSFTDLTGGLGVDFSFIARNFNQADYVERQEVLCELAQHNFTLLGLNHVKVHQEDGIEFLKTMKPVDCLFLDPARRDSHGGKTVLITDCEPDVCALEDLLVERAHTVMIKLSPMLDMASALNDLKYVHEIHIVAVNNECKELIIILDKYKKKEEKADKEVVISCEQVVNNFFHQHFDFTLAEEKRAVCTLAERVENYLYEPGAALLKAGAYRILSERYSVKKLHANSHLYTSDVEVDFPGRCFRVLAVSGFGKKELKSFLQGVEKANLTVRNFPSTVAELRKKLKLKEGGDVYLFATTLANGDKVLIKCEKLSSEKNIN